MSGNDLEAPKSSSRDRPTQVGRHAIADLPGYLRWSAIEAEVVRDRV